MTGRFLLLRHARTAWNSARRIQGQRDEPLSDAGRAMAQAWRQALAGVAFDAVLRSDLGRAAHTAQIVADGRSLLHLRIDARLREQDWGRWVGMDIPDVLADPEFERQTALGWDFRPPGGESRREVLARATAALHEAAAAHPGRTWLTITHQGVIKALVYHLRGHDMLPGHELLDRHYRIHALALGADGGLRLESAGEPLPEGLEPGEGAA